MARPRPSRNKLASASALIFGLGVALALGGCASAPPARKAMSPEVFKRYTAQPPFSLVQAYLQLTAAGETINAFRADKARWLDLGRKEDVDRALELFGAPFFESLKREM